MRQRFPTYGGETMVQDLCFCGKPARGYARDHRKDSDHYCKQCSEACCRLRVYRESVSHSQNVLSLMRAMERQKPL